jgi:hypothetical protein
MVSAYAVVAEADRSPLKHARTLLSLSSAMRRNGRRRTRRQRGTTAPAAFNRGPGSHPHGTVRRLHGRTRPDKPRDPPKRCSSRRKQSRHTAAAFTGSSRCLTSQLRTRENRARPDPNAQTLREIFRGLSGHHTGHPSVPLLAVRNARSANERTRRCPSRGRRARISQASLTRSSGDRARREVKRT